MSRRDSRPAPGRQAVGPDAEAIDPDVDLHVPAQQAEPQVRVLAAVAAGGAVGASARYGVSLLWPAPAGAFPWATLWINASGCLLIGVLMVLIGEGGRAAPHPMLRPFAGVGVLGGFTTFSTYALDLSQLLDAGRARTALAYGALTVVAALGAVWTAASATRFALRRRGTGGADPAAGTAAEPGPGRADR